MKTIRAVLHGACNGDKFTSDDNRKWILRIHPDGTKDLYCEADDVFIPALLWSSVVILGMRSESADANGTSIKDLALALVVQYPGCTAWELASRAGHSQRETLARRLSELRNAKLVRNKSRRRKCAITGRKSDTWWPGEAL